MAEAMNCRSLLHALLGVVVAVPVFAQSAATDIADQVRQQGYPCDGQVKAQRDTEQSRPDEQAWILNCANATYRVRLVPDMVARIEKLQ
jgi:hypothetical protein